MTTIGSAEDQLAIRSLLEAYGDAVAQNDPKAWGDTWAADAVWEILDQTLTGRDAIVAFWQSLMAGFSFTAFAMSIGRIAIDGDRATLRVYVSEELWDKDDKLTRIKGRYDDELTRTTEGWRFSKRAYTILKMF
jgi:uncharacterized protein (TIGR02246 family)